MNLRHLHHRDCLSSQRTRTDENSWHSTNCDTLTHNVQQVHRTKSCSKIWLRVMHQWTERNSLPTSNDWFMIIIIFQAKFSSLSFSRVTVCCLYLSIYLFIFNWRGDAVHVMWFITLPSIFSSPNTPLQLTCSQNNISWMQVCIFTAIILCSCKTQDHISVGCLRTYLQHINHSALFRLYWYQWFSSLRSITDRTN